MAKNKGAKAGRAKQKQKAQRSGGGDATWTNPTQQRRFRMSDDDEDDEVPRTMFRGFDGTTSRHPPQIDPSIKLRHRSIAFVSAGSNTPLESDVKIDIKEQASIEADQSAPVAEQLHITPAQVNIVADTLQAVCQISNLDGASEQQAQPEASLPFVIDTVGDTSHGSPSIPPPRSMPLLPFAIDTVGDTPHGSPAIPPPRLMPSRVSSPALSVSDEEVIVFRGRKKTTNIEDPISKLGNSHSSHHAATLTSPKQTAATSSRPAANGSTEHSSTYKCIATDEWTPAPSGAWWRKDQDAQKNNPAAVRQPSAELIEATRQAAGATVAVLHTAWAQSKRAEERAKGSRRAQHDYEQARTHQKLSKREKRGNREREKREELIRELETLDTGASDPEEAAYRDYVENLQAQHEEGSRSAAGRKGQLNGAASRGHIEMSQAQSEEDMVAADLQVQLEESALLDERETTGWEDTEATGDDSEDDIGEDFDEIYGKLIDADISLDESSELEEQIEEAEREIMQAEDELHDLRLRSMTDEQLARLWAKQSELGIDAEELLIDDGEFAYTEKDAGFGDLGAARAGLPDYIALSRNKRGSRRSRRQNQDMSFPDASALADAVEQYGSNGFDIMDLDRPSLRPTKKGRKGKMPAELEALSDEELRESVVNAWDNDRAKKRLKKAEREELRAQGLLGSLGKMGKADFDQKYQQGMTLGQIQVELEIFLQDEGQTTRAFPPMDKADRKALHEIASVLGLKSKSVGAGLKRAPVLYKTKSTRLYNEATINRAMGIVNRRFLKNQSFRGKVSNKGATPFKRSGGTEGTGLRHGELVGAGAKEIGKENFGSRLMEKMGWTRGTALGKDGEGVLHPVEQVMRIGKAGLG